MTPAAEKRCGVRSYDAGTCDLPKGHRGDHQVQPTPDFFNPYPFGYRWRNRRRGAYDEGQRR